MNSTVTIYRIVIVVMNVDKIALIVFNPNPHLLKMATMKAKVALLNFINVRTMDGYIRINLRHVSEVIPFPGGFQIIMLSGRSYLVSSKQSKKLMEYIDEL